MKILFDTNIFRDIQRKKINSNQIQKAKEKIHKHSWQAVISPLTLIELGSHINDDENDFYERYRVAFEAIVDICNSTLPDPEVFMRKKIFNHPIDSNQGLSPEETLNICRFIATTKKYEDLTNGKIMTWNDIPSRIILKTGYLKQFRDEYEQQYISDMQNFVLDRIVPNHNSIRANGMMPCIKDKNILTSFNKFIDSVEFENTFYKFQAVRVNVLLIGSDFSSVWDKNVKAKLSDYCSAYKWIIKKIAEAGYNPIKNKNDYNDIHFLIYLADSTLCFVTHDGGILNKIDGMPNASRVINFQEWLDK